MPFTGDITLLIPQRAPFVMIDQLVSSNDKTTQTRFLVKKDNIFVENGLFCEPGLLENIAQTAAARAGYVANISKEPVRVGYIGGVKDVVIYSLPACGDELDTEITLLRQVFEVSIVRGKVFCKGNLVAECEMKIFIAQIK